MADDPLQECEQILKNIQHLARIGSWRYYVPEGRLWWSDELYRIFGIDRENGDLSMQTVLDRIHPEDRENFRSQVSGGLAHRSDYRIVMRDGTVKYIHEEVRVEQDAAGKPVRMHGTAQDITERRQADEALRLSKEILEKTFYSLDSALFILDNSAPPVITDCNPAAAGIFGYKKEEMVGHTTAFLHVNSDALAEFQKMNRAAIEKQGLLSAFEFRMKRKNGGIFPSEHSVLPLNDDHGGRIGWVSVIRDITERKRTEEEVRESKRYLEMIIETVPT